MQKQSVQPVLVRHPAECSSLEAQLLSLYGERQWLERELGCSSATAIVARVRGLEAKLAERRIGSHDTHADAVQEDSAEPLAASGAEPGAQADAARIATPNSAMDQSSSLAPESVADEPAQNQPTQPDEAVALANRETPDSLASVDPEQTPAALPAGRLDQVVRALGLLATELAPRFGSSELLVEGEVEGVRFSLRCQSPEAGS